MSSQERRFGRHAAEALLGGVPAAGRAPQDALARLLAAAAATGHPSEVAGEQRVLAAFRAARLRLADPPRHAAPRRYASTRVLTLKIAAVLAATVAGSVAIVAGSGVIPNPLRTRAVVPTASTSAAGSGQPAIPSRSTGSPAASPSLAGLCRAYAAEEPGGKRSDNPAFGALVAAAGGKNAVEEFCTRLLAVEPGRTGPPGAGPPGNVPPSNGPPGNVPPSNVPPSHREGGDRPPSLDERANPHSGPLAAEALRAGPVAAAPSGSDGG